MVHEGTPSQWRGKCTGRHEPESLYGRDSLQNEWTYFRERSQWCKACCVYDHSRDGGNLPDI